MMSPEERKIKTEALLASLGVPPINPYLPLIEAESEARIRSAKEVARRCGVLYALADVGHDADRSAILKWLKAEGLWKSASKKEKEFFLNPEPSIESRSEATWQVEKIYVFLWALGHIDVMELPCQLCNGSLIHSILPPLSPITPDSPRCWAEFIRHAKLRSVSEILDAMDLIYRIDWAVVEFCVCNNQPPPAGFDQTVVYERHYALNWLTYYADDWDDITCDT
jgi:hypothetical protein